MSENIEAVPFGARLLAELERKGGNHLVTGTWNYQEIQSIRRSDREALVSRLRGAVSYEFLQRLKKESPAELAQYMLNTLSWGR